MKLWKDVSGVRMYRGWAGGKAGGRDASGKADNQGMCQTLSQPGQCSGMSPAEETTPSLAPELGHGL